MNDNYLSKLRRRARRHMMLIRKSRSFVDGYHLIDVSDSKCGFDAFGGPVDLKDIEDRLNWMEENDQ